MSVQFDGKIGSDREWDIFAACLVLVPEFSGDFRPAGAVFTSRLKVWVRPPSKPAEQIRKRALVSFSR